MTHTAVARRIIIYENIEPKPEEPPSKQSIVWRATLKDLEGIFSLEWTVFDEDRMSLKSVKRFLIKHIILVTRSNTGHVTGAVFIKRNRVSALIYSLGVLPQYRNQGLAQALLESAIIAARPCKIITLNVHEKNLPAQTLYKKFKFKQYSRQLKYYKDGGDALKMKRKVPALSKTNPCYCANNIIIDKQQRVEPVSIKYNVLLKLWVIWGYKWNKYSQEWSELQLFYTAEFDSEEHLMSAI